MNAWNIAVWDDVLSIKNGKSQKKVLNPDGPYPIYGSGGIMGYADDYLCEAETTVIGRKGSINNPLFVDRKFWNVDTAFGLHPGERLDNKFFYYFCLTYNFLKHNKATTLPSLTKTDLLKIKIPLPPLPEQKKIAEILDAADSLRQKDQQLIDHYNTLSQSLFLDMFGDPVTNPMGWENVRFENVGTLDRGKSKHRPRNAPELLGGIHPLIQTGDVANCGGYISEYKSTYSDFGLKQSKMWDAGTLCITIAANIAKTGILAFDACFPDSVVGFINNERSNIEFIKYWMSFLQKILEDSAPMAAQKNINLRILRELEIPLPPIKLQNQFGERIIDIGKQKEQAQASLQKSEDLFNSLLQRAFKGELTS